MKKRKAILTILSVMAAMFISCSLSFASQAVVDDYYGQYNHPSRFENCLIIDGIDVSYWQKDIDWSMVKRQGIDYALLRIGYTGLDSPFSMNVDSYFEQNYVQAREAGVMVGVYYYSCATSITEAQKEAKYVLELLDGRELDLPLVFDFEFAGRIKDKYKTKAATTSNILAFLNYIQNNSTYEPMFYSYRNIMDPTWSPKFNMDMIDGKYKVWIAQYSLDISYSRPFDFWQYASDGKINGIEGNVDCNFWYYDNAAEVTAEGTVSIKDAQVTLDKTSYLYNRYQIRQPIPTVTYNDVVLAEGVDYKVNYIKNVNAGTAYVMITGLGAYSNVQLVPFEITSKDIGGGNGTLNQVAVQNYTGKEVKPSVVVKYTGTKLEKGVDYDITYSNNTKPGTASFTVTGKRNYYGSLTGTFEIKKTPEFTGTLTYNKTLADPPVFPLDIQCDSPSAMMYQTSDPTIATVSETGEVTLTGTPGTATITVSVAEAPYYSAAAAAITVNVTGDAPVISTDVPTTELSTDDGPINLQAVSSSGGALTYTSSDPSVLEVTPSGEIVQKKPGQATITITCAANGIYPETSTTITFTVTKSKEHIIADVQSTTIKGSSSTGYGYMKLQWAATGNEPVDYFQVFRTKTKGKFGTTVYYKTKSSDELSYKNTSSLKKNTTYYYKVRGVKVIDGKKYFTKWSNVMYRKYKSTSTSDIKIINGVKATTVKATSSRGKGYIKTKWTKSAGYKVDYYQITRSTTKTFKAGTKVTYKTSTGKRLYYKNTKNLKKGKRYYYRIRGVRTIDGKKYYTKWSNTVTRIAK